MAETTSPFTGMFIERYERQHAIILDALRDAKRTLGLSAPVRVLGKIDHAIALLTEADNPDDIDSASEVYADWPPSNRCGND